MTANVIAKYCTKALPIKVIDCSLNASFAFCSRLSLLNSANRIDNAAISILRIDIFALKSLFIVQSPIECMSAPYIISKSRDIIVINNEKNNGESLPHKSVNKLHNTSHRLFFFALTISIITMSTNTPNSAIHNC